MNEGRQLHLSSCSKIDSMDHMLDKNCGVFHRTWKHWHSAVNLAKKLAVTDAHDIHLEPAEGDVEPLWKIEKSVDFHRFRKNWHFRCHDAPQRMMPAPETTDAKTTKKRRAPTTPTSTSLDSTHASIQQKRPNRLCGDLSSLHNHIEKMWSHPKNSAQCKVCGALVQWAHCAESTPGATGPGVTSQLQKRTKASTLL